LGRGITRTPPLPHLPHASGSNHPHRKRRSKPSAKGMDAMAATRRKRKKKKAPPADSAKKNPGGRDPTARGLGLENGASSAAPSADAGGRGAALVECTASCCVLCACVPVAALCCVARAPIRAARRCCSQWRRRPRRRLAPGGSSSFSDAEVGEFLQGRSAMTREDSCAPSR
jgi:hypothetical protein